MKVLEVLENRIRVELDSLNTTVVAKYEDVNGVYFFNENLEKEYVTEISKPTPEPPSKAMIEYYKKDGSKDKMCVLFYYSDPNNAYKEAVKNFKKISKLKESSIINVDFI